MIFDALKYELEGMFPDSPAFFESPDDDDQSPPYFNVNLVSGVPSGSGQFGRWQIMAVHSDKFLLEGEIIPQIKKKFHDQSGLFGEPGKEEAFKTCGVVMESTVSKGENSGVYYKSVDLKIYYK